ncbi:MAG: DUF1232 domain-containing protein [Anaerovoracaceae bacterium]
MQFFGFRMIFKRIKAIRFMMKDKSVPKRKKALIVVGIAYLVLPIDLIPLILFPPLAWLDDMILWLWILWYLRDELDKYWVGGKEVDLSRKYSRKKVIIVDKKKDKD